jgi:hypothetical protein
MFAHNTSAASDSCRITTRSNTRITPPIFIIWRHVSERVQKEFRTSADLFELAQCDEPTLRTDLLLGCCSRDLQVIKHLIDGDDQIF